VWEACSVHHKPEEQCGVDVDPCRGSSRVAWVSTRASKEPLPKKNKKFFMNFSTRRRHSMATGHK
jgi:hypothetical protein